MNLNNISIFVPYNPKYQCKYWLSFNSKDHEVKNSTKTYWDIADLNQTEFDLKNIEECCQHLTTNVVLKIV